jgi:uncharacterized protein (TIGR03790 family)
LAAVAWSQTDRVMTDRVMVVANEDSALSRRLASFYQAWHGLPEKQVCRIRTLDASNRERETIPRDRYDREIAAPLQNCLVQRGLRDQIRYLVLTQGIPIRVQGQGVKEWPETEQASVDSELTLLYERILGRRHTLAGAARNPFYRQRESSFDTVRYGIYLVTRLAGYSFEDARRAVERCRGAKNVGKAVLDMRGDGEQTGEEWLRNAAILLPEARAVLEESPKVLHGEKDVIAYASWGSNDRNRKSRQTGFTWLPGAIAAEYVSSSARTLTMPPYNWTLGTWSNPLTWFAGSPQSMILDYVWEGVSGISGATDEPYLGMLPRPDLLIPAYLGGRNLAESFYLAQPVLSWHVMILGDPLCRLQ